MKLYWGLPFLSLLAACGGGSGGSGSTPTMISPTPTPTPTVTPAPTYSAVYNFAGGFIINSIMAESSYRRVFDPGLSLVYDSASPATAALNPSKSAAQINLQASPLFINLLAGTDRRQYSDSINVFDNRQLSVSKIVNENGSSSGSFFTVFNGFGGTTSQTSYIGFSTLIVTQGANRDTRSPFSQNQKYFLFGSRTLPSDLPKSGTATYKVMIGSSTPSYKTVEGLFGEGSITVDFSTNQLRGTLLAHYPSDENGPSSVQATLNFTGTLDAANNDISGEITSSDSSFRGTLNGSLFGPVAKEIGFLIAMRSDVGGVVGEVAGLQP